MQAAESERTQAEAQLAAAQSTYDRLKKAAETPGAIAGNELVQAEKQVEAARAVVQARAQAGRAATAAAQAQKDMQAYLRITAPFDGVVTERTGAPRRARRPGRPSRCSSLQQVSHLRLVVAVPEQDVGAIARGASVPFRVPAFPERDLHRDRRPRRARARSEDPHHGRRARCRQSRWLARPRDVPDRQMAGPQRTRGALRPEDQRRHHHRAHVRDPRSRGPRRVGRREEGRGRWRSRSR